jgi:hypothetical protein
MEITDYEFDYSDLVKRGFKEFNSNDKNFEDQHGFRDFSLQKKTSKRYLLNLGTLKQISNIRETEEKAFY